MTAAVEAALDGAFKLADWSLGQPALMRLFGLAQLFKCRPIDRSARKRERI
jgi:hypothetical protein